MASFRAISPKRPNAVFYYSDFCGRVRFYCCKTMKLQATASYMKNYHKYPGLKTAMGLRNA